MWKLFYDVYRLFLYKGRVIVMWYDIKGCFLFEEN